MDRVLAQEFSDVCLIMYTEIGYPPFFLSVNQGVTTTHLNFK